MGEDVKPDITAVRSPSVASSRSPEPAHHRTFSGSQSQQHDGGANRARKRVIKADSDDEEDGRGTEPLFGGSDAGEGDDSFSAASAAVEQEIHQLGEEEYVAPQADGGGEEEDDEYQDDDGEESEEEPLATAVRRAKKQKRQEDVKGLYKGESILPEEEFGSKTVIEVYTMIKKGMINLSPSYQRDTVWPVKHCEGLIDSLLRNMHVPHLLFNVYTPATPEHNPPRYPPEGTDDPLYASCAPEEQIEPAGTAAVAKSVMSMKGKKREEREGDVAREVWNCADGKQRMSAIVKFIDGEFDVPSQIGGKFTYDSMPDSARAVFESKRLRYGFFRELTEQQEREIFKRVQLGKALDKGEIMAAIDAPYADWAREFQAMYFSKGNPHSFRPRLNALSRGTHLVAAYAATRNILVAKDKGLAMLKNESDSVRKKNLSSNRVPSQADTALVQQVMARFYRLTLVQALDGEDSWPDTPLGRSYTEARIPVPHRVWRLKPEQIGKKAAATKKEQTVTLAPVELHFLPAVVYEFDEQCPYDGQMLELIENLRIHLHRKFPGEMKDNSKVWDELKKWCRDFDVGTIKNKYRDDGSLRGGPRAKKRAPPPPPEPVAAPAKKKKKAVAPAPAPPKKKAPAPQASTSTSTRGGAGPSSSDFLPSATPQTQRGAVSQGPKYSPGAVLPFGSPVPAPVASGSGTRKNASAAGTVPSTSGSSAGAGKKRPLPPPPPPTPAPQQALSAKQQKYASAFGAGGFNAPAGSVAAAAHLPAANAGRLNGMGSFKKRGREREEFQVDERGRPIYPSASAPAAAAQNGGGYGPQAIEYAEMAMADYDAIDEQRRADEERRKRAETQAALGIGRGNGGGHGGGGADGYRSTSGGGGTYGGGGYGSGHQSPLRDEPLMKRVKREPDADDQDREREKALQVKNLLLGGGGGGGAAGPRPGYSRESSRRPDERERDSRRREDSYRDSRDSRDRGDRYDDRDRDRYGGGGGGGRRFESDAYAAPRERERDGGRGWDDRDRGGYRNGGGGYGGGGSRDYDRGGRYEDDYYRGGSGGRRDDEPPRAGSATSRLPPGALNKSAGNGGSGGGYGSSYPPSNGNGAPPPNPAAAAYGQRGQALADQGQLAPPTQDPRKRRP
ncbi:hypothetical protein JCM10213_007773 [Rhodosporidiobolus nylandii]